MKLIAQNYTICVKMMVKVKIVGYLAADNSLNDHFFSSKTVTSNAHKR